MTSPERLTLLYTTRVTQIDDPISGLIRIFGGAFPGRVRSYYLVGSYTEGSATPFSDIDIRIIFKDAFQYFLRRR